MKFSNLDINEYWSNNLTEHMKSDRQERIDKILNQFGDFGTPICGFLWDKGHKNGAEVHIITSKALIVVFNVRTKLLCTVLIARPGQIVRYWNNNECQMLGNKMIECPNYLMYLAKTNMENDRNNW